MFRFKWAPLNTEVGAGQPVLSRAPRRRRFAGQLSCDCRPSSLSCAAMVRLVFLAMLASSALVGHTLLDEQGWQRRQKLQSDLQTLDARNQRLARGVEALTTEVEALSQRKDAQEHAVRDELGWVRSNDELVIDFEAQVAP
ncbi:MAG: hypothetical protein EOO40_06580 [Deltaproteobacteria bacterium]|nr:MAG: hypothetical protein EOO40_06580 [Deltaproteobacteria bacterium]